MPLHATIRTIFILAAVCSLFASCEQDDSWSDNYITNFADLLTDSKGQISRMQLDDGTILDISNSSFITGQQKNALTPDSTYRCVCIYTRTDNTASIHTITPTFSSLPISENTLYNLITDPCTIKGIWRAGEYINARMLIQGKELPHNAAFIDQGTTTNHDGSKILHILLYHNQGGDMEAFTQTIYISCPLRNYRNTLTHGQDSIYFSVNQYEKGLTTFKLAY